MPSSIGSNTQYATMKVVIARAWVTRGSAAIGENQMTSAASGPSAIAAMRLRRPSAETPGIAASAVVTTHLAWRVASTQNHAGVKRKCRVGGELRIAREDGGRL